MVAFIVVSATRPWLSGRAAQTPAAAPSKPDEAGDSLTEMAGGLLGSFASQALKTAARQMANQVGRELVRGLLGSLLGGKRR